LKCGRGDRESSRDSSSELRRRLGIAAPYRYSPHSSHVVGLPLGVPPHDLAPYRLSAPAAWFVHLAVFESWGRSIRIRTSISPSGLAPLQSITRVAAHRRARSQRFAIPKRNPAVEIHHSRAFACPGHVAPSRLPCASAPYSLDGLPGVFQPGALSGSSPFRA